MCRFVFQFVHPFFFLQLDFDSLPNHYSQFRLRHQRPEIRLHLISVQSVLKVFHWLIPHLERAWIFWNPVRCTPSFVLRLMEPNVLSAVVANLVHVSIACGFFAPMEYKMPFSIFHIYGFWVSVQYSTLWSGTFLNALWIYLFSW